MESNSREGVDFGVLQNRLRDAVNRRINNGEFTERGFARFLGISQPQVHNVLKGARKLSPETADLILAKLQMTVLDLLTESEISAYICGHADGVPKKPPAQDRQPRRRAEELAS